MDCRYPFELDLTLDQFLYPFLGQIKLDCSGFQPCPFQVVTTPRARPPSVLNCAHTPAVPQKSSKRKGGGFPPD